MDPQERTDKERLDWLEGKCQRRRIVASASRVTGLFRLHAVSGSNKGAPSVRAAIDRAIEREERKALGLSR